MSTRQANIGPTTFTKTGPVVITITTIQSVSTDWKGQSLVGRGDADFYPTFGKTIQADPHVTITHQNKQLLNTLKAGDTGTLSCIIYDALNVTGAGQITMALINGRVENHQAQAGHIQLTSATLNIGSYSSDGSTSPLSFTIA